MNVAITDFMPLGMYVEGHKVGTPKNQLSENAQPLAVHMCNILLP